jgi:hypothetical protein
MSKTPQSLGSEMHLGSLSLIVASVCDQVKAHVNDHTGVEFQERESPSILELLEQADLLYKRTLMLALLSRCTFEEIEKLTGIPVLTLAGFFRQVQDSIAIHGTYNHNFKLGG